MPSKTTPKKSSREDDDDDDDDMDFRSKKKSKPSAPEKSGKPKRPVSAASHKKSTGSGWGAVAAKKREADVNKERIDAERNKLREVKIKDGETAVIQFLDDEPLCMDGHNIKDGRGYWKFVPCQLGAQKHCLMCSDGIKTGWKAAFRCLDFRGEWVKDKRTGKGDFANDGKPVEKVYMASATVAQQINSLVERKGKALSEMVLEVTRTGSGAKDTAYAFDIARDDDDRKIKPIAWKSKHDLEEELAPMTDDELEAMGFEGGD